MQNIRRVRAQDRDGLRDLLEKYFASIEPEVGQQDASAAAAFYTREPASSWIAEVDGKPAGCVGLRPLSARACEVKHLFVDPAFRGNHLGRALLEAAHTYARATGCEEIYLDSLPSMTAALKLYAEMGYTDTERYNTESVCRVFMRLEL